jgi:hypothetical protein
MSRRDIRQDVRPLLWGNIGIGAFVVGLLTRLFNRVQMPASPTFLRPG